MGIESSMRTLLALLALAIVANAHWTHDESLAREIGPPPGEEDIDVASLSDELISTGEKEAEDEDKTYRVTVGTRAILKDGSTQVGGSTSKFKIWLKGADTADFVGGKHVRYYQGPVMTYDIAEEMAPAFRYGMVPLIDTDGECTGDDSATRMPKICNADLAKELDPCEPNGKACKRAISDGGVGYALGPLTKLDNNPEGTSFVETGPIQRGQVKFKDVGQITEAKMAEDVSWAADNQCYSQPGRNKRDCSSPWAPAFVKISTNDPKTGIGNGIFYIRPRDDLLVGTYGVKGADNQEQDVTEELKAKPAAPTESGLPDDNSFNAVLTKCIAQTCEEEMDTKFGMLSMKTEFGETYESLE